MLLTYSYDNRVAGEKSQITVISWETLKLITDGIILSGRKARKAKRVASKLW